MGDAIKVPRIVLIAMAGVIVVAVLFAVLTLTRPTLTDGEWLYCYSVAAARDIDEAAHNLGLSGVTYNTTYGMWDATFDDLSGDALRNDPNYVRACKAVYAATH
jgi:hypothetical protein